MEEEKINFNKEEEVSAKQDDEQEMTGSDFKGNKFIKTAPVGEALILNVEKVIKNKNTSGTNGKTGKKFNIGLLDKNKNLTRIDIHTTEGVYTIGSWEVYFKLVGKDGVLMQYAADNNDNFKGAKVSIVRNHEGQYASYKIPDLAKIKDMSEADAEAYQKEIQVAIKEKRLYTIELV